MTGLTVSEIRGTLAPVPILDRLAETGCDALIGAAAEPHDLREYAELAIWQASALTVTPSGCAGTSRRTR